MVEGSYLIEKPLKTLIIQILMRIVEICYQIDNTQ